ncbi:MAG TPA: tRNA (adenosine(37)-N6)-threonylcarbamoyltransferase complex transferase subunit TsaD [Chloroflexota bacterium]|nr:tRNA (adenosine(37)-N6)-threonylcarbamoyltransferase complex transferase subunit TsaD [Chloroflexota bacterium]
MLILAIETSCDETSCAVVQDGRLVRSNVVASQIDLHAPYGGVVPEIASRRHVEIITLVARQALDVAGARIQDLDAIAATRGPGLAGALLVGFSFGRGLAQARGLPFIPVNHLEGHLHSVWLTRDEPMPPEPKLPLMALIVSGGHTELVLMNAHGDYIRVGRTLDDAAGEAFDKVARLLGLGYPGGPAIQAAAAAASSPVTLPRAWLRGTHDFSFSGLKTATLHVVARTARGEAADVRGAGPPSADLSRELTGTEVANIAAGFQESVVDVLVVKTMRAAEQYGARSIAVVGGVAANRLLRERMEGACALPLYISPPEFSTDNAAMIAAAAYFARAVQPDCDIKPNLPLAASRLVRAGRRTPNQDASS